MAGRSGSVRTPKLGRIGAMRRAAGEAAAAGGCGKAALLWMADGNGRALGKRPNALGKQTKEARHDWTGAAARAKAARWQRGTWRG